MAEKVFRFEVGGASTGQGLVARLKAKFLGKNQYRFRIFEAPELNAAEDWGAPSKILIPTANIRYLTFEFPSPGELQQIGKEIAAAIFKQRVPGLFATSLARAGFQEKALRVMFSYHKDADISARNFPWESIFYTLARGREEHFGLSTALSVARFLPPPQDNYDPLPVADKLRVLAVAANPTKCAIDLGVTAELAVIEELGRNWDEEIVVHPLVDARWQDFNPALVQAQPHILFFTGHGGFVNNEPHLFFQHPSGDCEPVSIGTLAAALKTMPSLKLVILSACQTASPRNPFVSGAEQLIQSGVPAVIAMQSKVDDVAAREFSIRFFTYLFQQDYPIDRCVNAGRQAMQDARRDKTEWAVPVLFLATRNEIFDFRASAKIKQEESKRRASMEEKFPLPVDPFIPRPPLTEQFSLDSSPRLTVVSGPFGAGKTQLTSKFCIEMIRTHRRSKETDGGSQLFFYVRCKEEWETFYDVLVELDLQTRELGFLNFRTIINDIPRFGAENSIRMFSELLALHDLVIVFDDYVWEGAEFWHELFLHLANHLRRSKVFVITSSPQHAGIGQQSHIEVAGFQEDQARQFFGESEKIDELMTNGHEYEYLPWYLKLLKDVSQKEARPSPSKIDFIATDLETKVLQQLSVLRKPVTLNALALMLAPDGPAEYLETAYALQSKSILTFTRNLGVELSKELQQRYTSQMNDDERRQYHRQAAVFYERQANLIAREEQRFHETESRKNQ